MAFELACVECGHLFTTIRTPHANGSADWGTTREETVSHALIAHHVADSNPDLILVWTATSLRSPDPRFASDCPDPWCYRPARLHPSRAERDAAAAQVAELAGPAVPAGMGIRTLEEVRPLTKMVNLLAQEGIARGGHWQIPLVRLATRQQVIEYTHSRGWRRKVN